MSEKLVEVYERYDIEITGSKRGRGATILTTPDGFFILEPFRGSVIRLEQEHVLKGLFEREGFHDLDVLIPNKDGELLTYDRYHQPFVLKRYFEGEECDMHSLSQVKKAVEKLAEFHVYGKKVADYFQQEWQNVKREKQEIQIKEIQQAVAEGEEPEQIARIYGMTPAALKELLKEQNTDKREITQKKKTSVSIKSNGISGKETVEDVLEVFLRRNRELRKIRKFVGGVKRKNSFENLFLQVYHEYYNKGLQCEAIYGEVMQGGNIQNVDCQGGSGTKQTVNVLEEHYGICHGNFNQHNIIMGENRQAIVHFERFSKGNQLEDLYQFARKVMEKNHFDFQILEVILSTYASRIVLSKADYRYIYMLFAYPEKFWKIANNYYNTNKAFLSPKYEEKLKTLIEQEKEKNEMLSQYYTFHLQGNSL